jgi:hypothetical protein
VTATTDGDVVYYILTCTKSLPDVMNPSGDGYRKFFSFRVPRNSVLKRTLRGVKAEDKFVLYSGKSAGNVTHRGVFFAIYQAQTDVVVTNKEFILNFTFVSEMKPKLRMNEILEHSISEGVELFVRCNGQRVITRIDQLPV